MKNLRGWVIAFILALLVGVVAYLGQPKQDSPEHSSGSDAANGTSAVRLFRSKARSRRRRRTG
jgi:hypothetical protein